MSGRTIAEAVLAIALAVALYFFFTQSNTLSETETSLENARSAGTVVAENAAATSTQAADSLSAAQDSATEFAEAANAEATELADQLDESYSSATEAAELAAENESNLMATATQAAEEASSALADMENSATESANMLAALEAEATEFAENAAATATQNADMFAALEAEATEQAQMIVDAVATSDGIQSLLDEAINAAATQAVELENALNTIDAQATAIAEMEAASDESAGGDTTAAEVPDDFVLFRTAEFDIFVPPEFMVFDLSKKRDEAIETFEDLGDGYEVALDQASDDTGITLVIGARDALDGESAADTLVIGSDDLGFAVAPEVFLAIVIEGLEEDGGEILEQGTGTNNGQDYAYFTGTQVGEFEGNIAIMYLTTDDTVVYILWYSVSIDNYEERREEYEASILSFTLIGD